jgi:signal transduction histidine kinase/ActR/RegA family two-component response regulator
LGSTGDWLNLVFFLVSSIGIALLTGAMQDAQARAGAAETQVLLTAERGRTAEALRQSEQEARRAQREAEAASRAKDDFLAALSHELRTPLAPVLMSAAALEHDTSLPADARQQLAMMRRNIELEARLIDDLLDLTRVSRGKLQIQPTVADTHLLLEHTEEIVRSDMLAKNVELVFLLQAPEHHVRADPARLQQVFWNLIKNALKFTGAGGRVTIRTHNPRPGRLAVVVTDTGIGIAPESFPDIFRPFEQGGIDGRHRFGGLGLGLSISKAIIDLHGGELRAASEGIGKGAVFTVELDTTIPNPQTEMQFSSDVEPPVVAPMRILAVEDHTPTLEVLVRLLERDGHRVVAASTVKEALAQAASNAFDMVISDLGLPDGSGLDLMREIKRLHGWQGIAVSGFGMETDVRASTEAGFDAHLVKPVDMPQLRRSLAALVAARQKRNPN